LVVVVVVFVIRAFGAWMLRIDDVIELQRDKPSVKKHIRKFQNKIHSDDEIFNRQ
jgi:hypothetical protein